MEKYLIWALAVAFAAYAARVGLALASMGIKQLALTLAGYLTVFGLSFGIVKLIAASHIIKASRYAVYFHLAVAVGLIVWSFISWGRKEKDHISYLLLLPCPFCLLTIVFSIYTATLLTNEPSWLIALSAYTIFSSSILVFFAVGRFLKVSPWEVMATAGTYYILLLAGARYYRDFKKVYSMGIKSSYSLPPKTPLLLFGTLLVMLLGVLRGIRTHG